MANNYTIPNNVGTLSFDSGDFVVTAPPATPGGTGQTIPFADTGLTVSGNNLQGSISNTLGTNHGYGSYIIAFKGRDLAGAADTATNLTINLEPQVPVPGTKVGTLVGNGGGFTLNNLSSHFSSPDDPIDNFQLASDGDPDIGLALTGTGAAKQLTGTIALGDKSAGVYTYKLQAHNQGGWSTSDFLVELSVASVPYKPTPASAPDNETINPGNNITNVDMSTYYSEQANIGTMTYAGNVTLLAPDGTTNIPLDGSGLTVSGSTLSGTINSATEQANGFGNYRVTFKASNEAGLAARATSFNIDLEPTLPTATNVTVNANNGTTYSLTNIASHFSSPDQPITGLRIDPDKGTGLTNPSDDPVAWSTIGLTQDLSGTGSITGTLGLASTIPGGTYTAWIEAQNHAGWSAPLQVQITVYKTPTVTGNAPDQSLETGHSITSTDLSSYFSISGPGTPISVPSSNVTVTGPGSPTLSSMGLSLSGNTISGTLPQTLAGGTYVISFRANNTPPTELSTLTSATAATLTLHVTQLVTLKCPTHLTTTTIGGQTAYTGTSVGSDGVTRTFTTPVEGRYPSPAPGLPSSIYFADAMVTTNGHNLECLYDFPQPISYQGTYTFASPDVPSNVVFTNYPSKKDYGYNRPTSPSIGISNANNAQVQWTVAPSH